MSVKSFLSEIENCDFSIPNQDIDDFIICVRRLGKILTNCFDSSAQSKRERKYNSVLSKKLGENDLFNPSKVYKLFTFSANSTQIDICIRTGFYFVSVSGAWRPDLKLLQSALELPNLNFDTFFEFPEIKKIYSVNGSIEYFGGSDFPLDVTGLNRILRLWSVVVSQCCAHIDVNAVCHSSELPNI